VLPETIAILAGVLHLSGMALLAEGAMKIAASMEVNYRKGLAVPVFVPGTNLLLAPHMIVAGTAGMIFLSMTYLYFVGRPDLMLNGSNRLYGTIGSFAGMALIMYGVSFFRKSTARRVKK